MTVCSPSSVSGWRSCWPNDRSVVFALAIPLSAYFPSAGWHGGASPSGRCIAIRSVHRHSAPAESCRPVSADARHPPLLLMVVCHAALHGVDLPATLLPMTGM